MQNLVARKCYLEQRKVCLIKVTSYFRQSLVLRPRTGAWFWWDFSPEFICHFGSLN